MRAIPNVDGSVRILSENDAEAFLLEHFRHGTELIRFNGLNQETMKNTPGWSQTVAITIKPKGE